MIRQKGSNAWSVNSNWWNKADEESSEPLRPRQWRINRLISQFQVIAFIFRKSIHYNQLIPD